MLSYQTDGLPAIVVIGELKENRAVFGNSFDPNYNYTEGQFRALHMKIQRLLHSEDFKFNQPYKINSGSNIYISFTDLKDKKILFCVILRDMEFSADLMEIITNVANRGGIYTAKRFFNEIVETHEQIDTISKPENLSYEKAVKILRSKTPSQENIAEITEILRQIAEYEIIHGEVVFTKCIEALESIPEDMDVDPLLDACFSIALKYENLNKLDYSQDIYLKIAEKSLLNQRLGLKISSLLKSAQISREQGDRSIDRGRKRTVLFSPGKLL